MLYEVIIGNFLDDSTRSKLILSHKEVTHEDAKLILSIEDGWEHIVNIKNPIVTVSAWDEKEWEELNEIKNLLNR